MVTNSSCLVAEGQGQMKKDSSPPQGHSGHWLPKGAKLSTREVQIRVRETGNALARRIVLKGCGFEYRCQKRFFKD